MTSDIRYPHQTPQEVLLGAARDGVRYRLTIEETDGTRRSGIVRASVTPTRIEYIPGKVTFVLEGDALNENQLYAGPVGAIVDLEEVR